MSVSLWQDYDTDPDDPDDEDGVTCRRCGETGLQWQAYWKARGEEGARLIDAAGRPHKCKSSASADEFPSG